MFSDQDNMWMQYAIQLAELAAVHQEVPVGAVLVCENKIIGEGYNSPISHCDPTAHAEIIALRQGALALDNYRLINSTLYVTLEPCLMCMGAIVHARVKKVIFGAKDYKKAAVESIYNLNGIEELNHRVECVGGLLADSCGRLLTQFFKGKRLKSQISDKNPFEI